MEWDDLRYVLAARRAGSLSGAAAELGVARTTVGRRLRDAEQRLGVLLFDRTPDGLVATAAGEELAETAERVEAEVLTTEGRLLGRDEALRGRLRVSTLDFVFEAFPELFGTFRERYPGIEVTVRVTTENVSLRRREADVALRLARSPAEHLVGRRMGTLNFEVYGARSLVARIGADAPLSAFPWIGWDDREDTRFFDGWLAENAPGAAFALRTGDFGVTRKALSAGLGIHFLPCCLGEPDPELVSLGHRLVGEARGLFVLTLADLRHNSRVRAFMDHAYAYFEGQRERMEGPPLSG
ncbi:MAG: LysR family transcriptional regulator [Myxococcota bacterium]